jgi:hypothetical protein
MTGINSIKHLARSLSNIMYRLHTSVCTLESTVAIYLCTYIHTHICTYMHAVQALCVGNYIVSAVPDFSLFNIPKRVKYTKWQQNIPNHHRILQNIPTLSTPRPSKMGIFSMKSSGNQESVCLALEYITFCQRVPNETLHNLA